MTVVVESVPRRVRQAWRISRAVSVAGEEAFLKDASPGASGYSAITVTALVGYSLGSGPASADRPGTSGSQRDLRP